MIAVAIAALIPVLAADGVVPAAFDESLAHGVARPPVDAALA
jgi:hypothetical protein